jgi:hypothetical protein
MELRPWAERPGRRLLRKRPAAWTSVAGLRCAGLPQPHLAVTGEPSPVLPSAVRSSFVPGAAVRAPGVRRSRIRPSRLRTARPDAAVLSAAMLPIALRRPALRPAAGKLARVLRHRLVSSVRPGGRCALRAQALHPRAVGWHALRARSVTVGATVTRPRPSGGLPGETGPTAESACRGRRPRPGSGPASRARTTAHAVVTRTPAKPRPPIPRALVSCETGIVSWPGSPAGPGVAISTAFVVRPVFGVRPPTPAPPPREPCHIIDRKHPGDR